jgi:hypothetical protein
MDDSTRRELIEYYKWVVALATFVLMFSLAALGLRHAPLRFVGFLRVGWLLLGICIISNILIVKRLVSLAVVRSVAEHERTALHDLLLASLSNIRVYGLVQNASFFGGVAIVAIGVALNLVTR